MKPFKDINIGDFASITHTIIESDINKFVDLTGDDNKIHIDKEYASKTEFKTPVVHGMLGASFISTVIGTKLPGDGALWFSQTLEFLRPVRLGDEITIRGEVIAKNDRDKIIELKTEIFNQYKQIVTKGIAKVKIIEQQIVSETEKQSNSQKIKEVALILGATGGIGTATSLKLAEDGFDIIVHYNNNKTAAQNLKEKIQSLGRKAFVVQSDLLVEASINDMFVSIERVFPSLSAFVNCTTLKIPNISFNNLVWDYMQKHIDINIKSSFQVLKKILPIFEKQKYGKIVFITSQSIETPNSDWLHYITAKSALHGFAKALAFEFAPKGIMINTVSPSMTDTELIADIPTKIKMLTEAKTPLRRLCKSTDVANAIAFLVSSKADFITGETIRINGGQVML